MDYKEIVLLRHGRPASEHNHKLTSGEFGRWVRDYNRALLHPDSLPVAPRDFCDHYIISSALRRARLSASLYINRPADEFNALFNEMEIPRYRLPGRFNAWTWVYLNRLLWMAGRPGPFESFAQARHRIRLATDVLLTTVEKHRRVVVFAHALTNRFLSWNLRNQGWQMIEKDHRYWGIIRLQQPSF
ncbi:phosphoglycerate mutase family protein [Salinimonas chungwhensis]|uniref:phosphoglycerate mutase family protein n=1 Tax=Salinimonas chungwhensis TaxID=265425 RepID=UPI00037EF340|nr:phosphoglycerate mutase family protein [Salinimonas chungwhensis]